MFARGGEGFAVDASLIAADANKQKIPEPVLVAIDIRDISFRL